MVCPACHVGVSNSILVFDVQSMDLMDMCRKEPAFWNCFVTNLTMTRGNIGENEVESDHDTHDMCLLAISWNNILPERL